MKSSKIVEIIPYEVIDSRGMPTVACIVKTEDGSIGKAMVPSGASTGEKEALELRDNDKSRYNGKGVLKAVENIKKVIAPAIIGLDVTKQKEIDEKMIKLDGTSFKTKLGANAILAVSLACLHAAAAVTKKPVYRYISENILGKKPSTYKLPVPMLNVINGGAHADNTIDFQEFMLVPIGAKNFHEAMRMSSEVFHTLQKILKVRKDSTGKGDEGGFAPNLKNAEEALDLMVQAIQDAGYTPGIDNDMAIALDVASSELYDSESKKYIFKKAIDAGILTKSEGTKSSDQMIDYLENLSRQYPIISIEDGLAENDWDGFKKLMKRIGSKVQIVGDDTYCTNPTITAKGVKEEITNAVLIKLNQIGSLTETIKTIEIAQKAGWCAVVSHRSGETEDTTIADLSVAMQTGQIKTGSMSRSERICKYNRLLEIENELGKKAKYEQKHTYTNLKL